METGKTHTRQWAPTKHQDELGAVQMSHTVLAPCTTFGAGKHELLQQGPKTFVVGGHVFCAWPHVTLLAPAPPHTSPSTLGTCCSLDGSWLFCPTLAGIPIAHSSIYQPSPHPSNSCSNSTCSTKMYLVALNMIAATCPSTVGPFIFPYVLDTWRLRIQKKLWGTPKFAQITEMYICPIKMYML